LREQASGKGQAGRAAADSILSPNSAARWLLLLLVASGVYFFHGFLAPVLAALVVAVAGWPVYVRLRRTVGGRHAVAAGLGVLLVLSFIVGPLAAGIYLSLEEVAAIARWGVDANRDGAPAPQWMVELPAVGEWAAGLWAENVGRPGALGEALQRGGANLGSIYQAVLAAGGRLFGMALSMVFMLFTLFFLFRDGDGLVARIERVGERILPDRWTRFSAVVPATIGSTVRGQTLIAIGEGIVLGIAYWLAGAPSPVTLGVITGAMALIPGGAPLSMSLVSAYLVASGSPLAGLALFAWGTVELFVVDKTIRPALVGGPIKLPFLLTIFGLVGGVKTMGLLGLFIGPVLMALLVAVWREWSEDEAQETGGASA